MRAKIVATALLAALFSFPALAQTSVTPWYSGAPVSATNPLPTTVTGGTLCTSGPCKITNTTPSTSPCTGALVVGTSPNCLGIGGGNVNASGTLNGDASPANITATGGSMASTNAARAGQFLSPGLDFGADTTGTTDATTALNNCLSAATLNPSATCRVDRGAKLKLLGNVTIPKGVTLDCGWTFPDTGDGINYALQPALMLDPGHKIASGGIGTTVKNCLIYRNGMTFPPANASAFAGTAIQDGGGGAMSIVNTMILGFDTCIDNGGFRPYIVHNYLDCSGSTHAALYSHIGNSDSGFIDQIKVQPFSTGSAGESSCAAAERPGTGIYINGSNFIGTIFVFDFETANITVASLLSANIIGTDNDLASCPAQFAASIGVNLISGAQLIAGQVNVNSANTGLLDVAGANNEVIGSLWLNSIGQDCVSLGAVGVSGGALQIGTITTNTGAATNCGRFLVNYLDSTGASSLRISAGNVAGVNGGSPPYVNIPSTVQVIKIKIADDLQTDLGATNQFYGAASVGSCTGLGASGACALASSDRTSPFEGRIDLTTNGTTSNSGQATLTLPLTMVNAEGCQATLRQEGGNWLGGGPAAVQVVGASGTTINFIWATPSAIANSTTYGIDFNCRPR